MKGFEREDSSRSRFSVRLSMAAVAALALLVGMLGGCLCCPPPSGKTGGVQPAAPPDPAQTDQSTGSIVHVTSADFEAVVLKSSVPVVVDFWAPWCGPCKLVDPILADLSRRYDERALIAKVNVDEEPQLADKYDIRAIPAVFVFINGEVVGHWEGFTDALEQELTDALNRALGR